MSNLKRTRSAAPSSPRKKRNKVPDSQILLDTFFSTEAKDRADGKGKAKAEASEQVQGAMMSNDTELDDELYAKLLAEQDGLDMDALAKLEETMSRTRSVEHPGPSDTFEVIDVDMLDDVPDPSSSGQADSLSKSGFSDAHDCKDPGKSSRSNNPSLVTAKRVTFGTDQSTVPEYQSLAVDVHAYNLDIRPWPIAAPYSFLAHALNSLSGTRSRIAILNILTNTLRTIIRHDAQSLVPTLYLLSNALSPPYSPIELGLGPAVISKAIQHVSGLTNVALKQLYKTTGDPGDVAYEAKSKVRTLIPHPPLLITGVYKSLLKVAHSKGQGAAKQKQGIIEKLLVSAKGEETRFLVRTLAQNLRVGAVRTSILTALARAMVLTSPPTLVMPVPRDSKYTARPEVLSKIKPLQENAKKQVVDDAREEIKEKFANAESLIKRVYVQHPNYDHIAQALLEGGLDGLGDRLPLTVGIPLLPTLGSPTRSLDEIYDRLGSLAFTTEFKYDGQRAQIHAMRRVNEHPFVKIFSRHLEDMTDKYPDVVSLVENILDRSPQTDSFIIDSEIVAIDAVDGSLKSFQELSNRARRDVKIDDVKIAVCVFAFDIMYLDKEILLERPFRARRSLLRSRFPSLTPQQKGAARFDHVNSCESEDGREAIEDFWQTALNSRCEGLMIKLLDSGEVAENPDAKDKSRRKPLPATYEPDKRTSAWLKLKKDYVTGIGDSLDLVPIGAWHGNGRKAQWWSPVLLALWDPDAGKLVAVCKCMSGFSDAFYKTLRERYPENSDSCSRQPLWEHICETGGLRPEVYFKPQEVWEIRGADVTLSPVSAAALGLVSEKRGLSLRFPRFMKIREDKAIGNASTPDFLAKMWHDQQGQSKDRTGMDEGELVDAELEETDIEESGSGSELEG